MYTLTSTTNLGQHKGHRGTRHRLPARRHHDKRTTTRSDGDQHHSDGLTPRHSTWISCSNSHARTKVNSRPVRRRGARAGPSAPQSCVHGCYRCRSHYRCCYRRYPAAGALPLPPPPRLLQSRVTRGGRRTGSTATARSRCRLSRRPRSGRGGAREAVHDGHSGSTAAMLTCQHRTSKRDQIWPGVFCTFDVCLTCGGGQGALTSAAQPPYANFGSER